MLAAAEDKRHPGAHVASPSMPWAWGSGTIERDQPSGPYHLVWARDLYQAATALLAAGDRAAALRELDFILFKNPARRRLLPAEHDRLRQTAVEKHAARRGRLPARARLAARRRRRRDAGAT